MSLPWVVLLSACIQQVLPGPDFGPCADVPEGTYGYGDAGIGTCIAGPADIRFFEQDGGTFLAVTNADPYRLFRSGSILLLDWDEIASRIDAEAPEEILVSEVAATALELIDDDDGKEPAGNPFLGGFGYLPEQQVAIVPSRLTEDAVLRSGRDDAYVLDLSSIELPGGRIEVIDEIELQDDPFPVVVDSDNERVYVGNLTDHSVSVLSSDPSPGSDGPLQVIDVAPSAGTGRTSLRDLDGSGSVASIPRLAVIDVENVLEDSWTLTFVEGSARVWVPTPVDDTVTGLVIHSTGDFATYVESAYGFDIGLGHVEDPFLEIDPETGAPLLWYARPGIDGIHLAASSYFAGDWAAEELVLSGGGIYASPTTAPLPGAIGLYTEFREVDDDTSAVRLATAPSITSTFSDDGPVLEPPDDGTSYEDPFVVFDSIAGRYRMWLAVRDPAGTTRIALSESEDGLVWSDPQTVLDAATKPGDGGLALAWAAPAVAVLEGRYGMWVTAQSDIGWSHQFAWSYDGRNWTDPVLAVESTLGLDEPAPRVAVYSTLVGGWRLEGAEQGSLDALLTAGIGVVELFGIEIEITNGQEVDNTVVSDQRSDLAIVPGSAVRLGDREILFASSFGSSSGEQILALERVGTTWSVAIDPDEMKDMLGILADEAATSPLVVPGDDGGWVMFFTRTDSTGSDLVRATSADGLDWNPPEGGAVLGGEVAEFDPTAQFAHSMEPIEGGVRLWYTGDDGSTYRIGSATADSVEGVFEREPAANTDFQFGTGAPGGFDDSSVRDPLVIELNGETHLYYAGLDGTAWHLGHAVRDEDGVFQRRLEPLTDLPLASLDGRARTFSAAGVESPTLGWATDDEPIELFYAGLDTFSTEAESTPTLRLGRAVVDPVAPDEIFAAQRFPTAGDVLPFTTERGGPGSQVIELGQSTQDFATSGFGMSGMALDEARGFLYVTSKLDDVVYVLDVRDDSDGDFDDANALDLESLLLIESGNVDSGFRDVVVAPDRGLMFLTSRSPDALVVIDLTRLTDDGVKDENLETAVAVMPLQSAGEDAGVDSVGVFGGAGMALTDDERFLLITHFRGNALSVFDLDRSAWGEEVAWLGNIGENPHVVRISPDSRYAVVANYVGTVVEQTVSSTLAVVDLDPASDRYLEAVTWLVNR